ncbi:MAG: hypothetical protein HKO67_11670 [Flavobacteriaceae bacterium]|nr:hypothetical protein [Flavobacteriaceae bacterium]
MRKILLGILLVGIGLNSQAQNNSELVKHYESYYAQMKQQGDMQGVIDAITHLNLLSPNKARKDTLAILYMNDGRHIQALNTIGFQLDPNDSDLAVEVKAVCLQELNQPERAIEQFEELYKRTPNILVAYELADLKTQVNDLAGATEHIEYGITNAPDDLQRTFYESQTPYNVPVKAAFIYLKGLVKYKENPKENIDAAIAIMDEALAEFSEFNLARLSKEALLAQKNTPQKDN